MYKLVLFYFTFLRYHNTDYNLITCRIQLPKCIVELGLSLLELLVNSFKFGTLYICFFCRKGESDWKPPLSFYWIFCLKQNDISFCQITHSFVQIMIIKLKDLNRVVSARWYMDLRKHGRLFPSSGRWVYLLFSGSQFIWRIKVPSPTPPPKKKRYKII